MCLNCVTSRRGLLGGFLGAAGAVTHAAKTGAGGSAATHDLPMIGAAAMAMGAMMATPADSEPTIVGSGKYRYRVENDWAKLPEGLSFSDAPAVAVDRNDNVYVFCRNRNPVLVFDREGNFLRSWGEGVGFRNPHGASIGHDDTVYLTDDGDHTVRKFTLDGKLLMTIGVPGKPAPVMSGEPFNRCTHTALSPQGEIYVSDGYSNARVHKYARDGRLLFSWGEAGTLPGQFNIVHNICCDAEGWVYVADRENHRVQVFGPDGRYETQWKNLSRPCGLFISSGRDPLCYIGELGPENVNRTMRNAPNLGPRVSILTLEGEIVSLLGTKSLGDKAPDQFVAPHGIAVDSRGDIYVAEVANSYWPILFGEKPDHMLRCFRKLVRLDEAFV